VTAAASTGAAGGLLARLRAVLRPGRQRRRAARAPDSALNTLQPLDAGGDSDAPDIDDLPDVADIARPAAAPHAWAGVAARRSPVRPAGAPLAPLQADDPQAADLEAPLDHPLWYRVAELHVRLRAHVRVQRRESRGEVWYLLMDPAHGRYHRVNRAAYAFVGRIHEDHSVGALWRQVHAELGEQAPTQADVMHILARLADAELLSADAAPDLQALLFNKHKRERAQRAVAVNPLAFKVPLFDPTRLLDRLLPLGRRLFTPWGALAWLLLVGGAAAAVWPHWARLQHDTAALAGSPVLLLTLWLGYPLVKALHELGHGLALRVWGGEVHEIGVTFMALTPVPYVDATAMLQIPQKRRRMAIGAAGIAVELAVAAVAALVWLAGPAPALQQTALALVLMCGASTLLVNANPLLRFDGYHALCDALQLPNLAGRSARHWLALWRRALGLPFDRSRQERRREAPWLAVYSLAALAYRWAISAAIVVWLHGSWPVLALLAALWLLWGLVCKPLGRALGYLLFSAQVNGQRARALAAVLPLAAAGAAALAWLPLPSASVQQGVVWLPEQAILRAPAEGTLLALHARSGQRIEVGTPVATLENLALHSELAAARAKAVALEVRRFQTLLDDSAKASRLAEESQALQAHIALLEQRVAQLQVQAASAGTLVLPRTDERLGHHYPQGRELGYVLPDSAPLVKLALTEAQAALLDGAAHPALGSAPRVSVRLASSPQRDWPATIERRTPQATRSLPSAALGQGAGGPIATDPADREGRTALQPVVLLDVRLDAHPELQPGLHGDQTLEAGAGATDTEAAAPAPGPGHTGLGQRAWVRIEHPGEPALQQAWRVLQQLFLRSLGARA
jgi:putative peptide zinc metalloprotease protein